jgi:hypothetical protein
MVFVFVVVLKVVGTMMFTVPSFDHHTLISFGGGLEEFLDFWGNPITKEELQIKLFIQWRRKFLQVHMSVERKDQTVSADHG